MKKNSLLVCVTLVLAVLVLPVQAHKWSAEELEVWQTISKQWDLQAAEDDAWMDLLHDSFLGWVEESPMPHDKATTGRFIAAEAGQFKIVVQDIQPVGIVVTGDTAIAHYHHFTILEYKDGERETTSGRFTDILTRTEDGWRILSWVGVERSDEDDSDS